MLATLAMTAATAATATMLGPAPIPPVTHPTSAPVVAAGGRHGEAWVRVPGTDSDHDGRPDRVHVGWHLPEGRGPFPVVLEASPYNTGLRRSPNHDVDVDALHVPGPDPDPTYRRWLLSHGYAYVTADSLGSGGSTGCPSSGGPHETAGMVAVVRWLAGHGHATGADRDRVAAAWSDQRVGMIGVSYNGTLANAAAASGVDGLDAVVAVSSISSWYDYYRSQGMVRAPGGYQGEDADVLARAVLTRRHPGRCRDELRMMRRRQARRSGDLTSFWRRRDYRRAASRVTAGVLTLHGTSDHNVLSDQAGRWVDALSRAGAPVRAWWHPGGHGDQLAGSGDRRWRAEVLGWFDHFLRDADNGVLDSPLSTSVPARGRLRTTDSWPGGQPAALWAGPARHQRGRLRLGPGPRDSATLVDDSRYRLGQLVRSAPRRHRLLWRTRPLASPVELSGLGRVDVTLSVPAPAANLSVGLVTIGPRGRARVVSAGWADPQNHEDLTQGTALQPGRRYRLSVDLDAVLVRRVRAGSRLGLLVASSDHGHTLRPPPGTRVRVHTRGTRLVLPVVGGQEALDVALSRRPVRARHHGGRD